MTGPGEGSTEHGWLRCSVRSRSRQSGELTLTALKPTYASAAGPAMNIGELLDSGRSRYLAAVWRRERPVPPGSADPNQPNIDIRDPKLAAPNRSVRFMLGTPKEVL